MNTNAYNILKSHKVTRLCHFTRFQSLTSILSSENGIIASKFIEKDVKNVTDNKRFDGKTDYICCSIEYPNSWYFRKVEEKNEDKIFKEFVVLYINIDILINRHFEFCPCNASIGWGRYIQKNLDNIGVLFTDFDGERHRTNKMLSSGCKNYPHKLFCCRNAFYVVSGYKKTATAFIAGADPSFRTIYHFFSANRTFKTFGKFKTDRIICFDC